MKETDTADIAPGQEEAASAKSENKTEQGEKRLEVLIAIFLAVTALLVSWATWIGSLHSGNQSTNYTESSIYASAGSSEYNAALQVLIQDMMLWNSIQDCMLEKSLALYDHDDERAAMIQDKADRLQKNASDTLREAIDWALEQDDSGGVSPFSKEGMTDSYFDKARELLDQSQSYLEEGSSDNRKSDKYGLVTVIYSLVMFLLGIDGIFKRLPNRWMVFWISLGLLIFAAVFMCTIPLPTGFQLSDYFLF